MPQLQIPVELVILHLAMLAFLEKHQVNYYRNFPPPTPSSAGYSLHRLSYRVFVSLSSVWGMYFLSSVEVLYLFEKKKGLYTFARPNNSVYLFVR